MSMKAVCLLSGGIDSPVAAQIAILNGFQPFLLHYHNFPFHSLGTLEKVVTLSNKIAGRNSQVPIVLIIISHGKTQEIILNNLEGRNIRQTCILCRMQMFSKAEKYAQEIGADVIITGEILGEQASQTLDNLPIVIAKVGIPVIRPLIGYNKEEVVQLSKKWDFYNSSILPGGCCSINPKFPETKGRLELVDEIFNYMSTSIEATIQNELESLQTFPLPVDFEAVVESIEI
ncbi:MAG: 7-cyano-7-deazaguanine synthase [Candidatus Heimdallarchaeota archaeon]|nr:MAG: 7-cyano-7-deazaguanine synthase [Candidatus Heimdallarchaeota archaeon]